MRYSNQHFLCYTIRNHKLLCYAIQQSTFPLLYNTESPTPLLCNGVITIPLLYNNHILCLVSSYFTSYITFCRLFALDGFQHIYNGATWLLHTAHLMVGLLLYQPPLWFWVSCQYSTLDLGLPVGDVCSESCDVSLRTWEVVQEVVKIHSDSRYKKL